MILTSGDRFDRYVIEEVLGEGGMARVYRAHDPRLHRRVALKVLRRDGGPEGEDSSQGRARVLREARAAAALDHPNAVAVFDVGEADGQLFIAMEHVVGKSLRLFVGDHGIPWDRKLRWMVDAARALAAAHDCGLVHRDVKPENIMVRSDGVVKVLDFGIAKRLSVELAGAWPPEDMQTASIQGGIVGTPFYLAPEQLRSDPIDARVDQFAWAVTTYELLTGALPWPKGVNGFQLVLAILDHTPDPPSAQLPSLPSIVDATIGKALAKTSAQRFETMEAVIDALDGLTSSSRRSWVEIHPGATTKTDPAPPMAGPVATTDNASTLPSVPARTHAAAVSLDGPVPPPRADRRRLVLATVAVGAVALLGLTLATRPRAPTASAVAVSATASPSAGPATLLTLPLPHSSVPEALAAYRSYRQAFRDADWSPAVRSLETATKLDPSLAAAHLRLAFLQSLEASEEGRVRTSFHAAERSRATLDDRDAALLDALEPYLQRQPSDPLESEGRLEAVRKRWPEDAEIAYVLGSVRYDRGEVATAVEAFDAAARIDPGFALALSSRGGCLAYLGRFDEARAALDAAIRQSPTATEPLWYEAEIARQEGRCADAETLARTWLARDPDDVYGYAYLADALASEGRPVDTVATALEQSRVRRDPDLRVQREPLDLAHLAVLSGDFTAATAQLEKLGRLQASEPGAQAHAEAEALRMEVAGETGQLDRAREIAASFLARKDAWSPAHRVDDTSILLDPVPRMLAILARGGGAPDASARRDAWLQAWRAKTASAYLGDLWTVAWAEPASTRDEAIAALEALPSFGGPPKFSPTIPAGAFLGHVLWLAGREPEAVAALRAGTASCTVLEEAIPHTRGWLDLGRALESQGDRDGACAAYGSVLARWGHARPRSVTADAARARAKALSCR